MIDTLFWLLLAVFSTAGIVLMIRGFVMYKETEKSRKQFLLSSLIIYVPRQIILIVGIWYLANIRWGLISIYIICFEFLLLLSLLKTLIGKKSSRVFRNLSMGHSIFFLCHLILLALYIGFGTLVSHSSLMDYFQFSDGYSYKVDAGEITLTAYYGFEKDIVIPSVINGKPVTQIRAFVFHEASSLTSVTIPESVRSIGESAFASCCSLQNVTISEGVTSMDGGAFENCQLLTSVTLPDSLTTIDENPFPTCSSLTEINVSPENSEFSSVDGVLYTKTLEKIVACPGGLEGDIIVPDSVNELGIGAFKGCKELDNVTISDNVRTIGDRAFYECSSLQKIIIPEGVTSIGTDAFWFCHSLTGIEIPASVITLETDAFLFCENMTYINVSPENAIYSSNSGLLYNKSQTLLISCPGGRVDNETIPAGVTAIGDRAFAGCAKITSVSIPDSVTSIGFKAFMSCDGLTSVVLPDGIENISSLAFQDCANLTSISIPDSVTSIGDEAFPKIDSLVIHCNEGSYAESYAEDNELKYELI